MGKVCTAQKGEGVGEGEREKSAKGTRSPPTPPPPPLPLPTNPLPPFDAGYGDIYVRYRKIPKISPAMYKPLQK